MNRTTLAALCALLTVLVICVTVLIALGRDANQLVGVITAGILPAVVALFGVNEASKSKEQAQKAAESAEQTVHQTNGRMTELIQTIQAGGLPVPPGYDDVVNASAEYESRGRRFESATVDAVAPTSGDSAR